VLGVVVVLAAGAAVVVARRWNPGSGAAATARSNNPSKSTSDTTARGGTTTTVPTFVLRQYTIGDCVTWRPSKVGQIETHVVPCDQPHLVEIVGSFNLDQRLRHFPSSGELQVLIATDCARETRALLGHAVGGDVQFGAIYPHPEAFDRGENTLWCWARKRAPGLGPETRYRGALN
jgi:hypothetical protein